MHILSQFGCRFIIDKRNIVAGFVQILGCSFLLVFMLLTGCKKAFHCQIQNNYGFEVKVINRDIDAPERIDFGNISAGGLLKPTYGLLDENTDYILDVQDTSGKVLGEVRQSQAQVHQHMVDGVWNVVIPRDFTSTESTLQVHK